MEILVIPVPLWLLLAVLAIAGTFVGWLFNRFELRLGEIDHNLDSMGYWADMVDHTLRAFERSEQRLPSTHRPFAEDPRRQQADRVGR